MHILVLSRYGPLGSTSRLRIFQYIPYLQAHDITVTVASFLSEKYLRDLYSGKGRRFTPILQAYARRLRDLRSASKFDLVWIEKEVLPWLPAWVERWLNRRRIPFVVDYDDATFHNYDRSSSLVVRRMLGMKIDEVMQRAALVIVGNDYLADRARLAGSARVEVVPTVIDLDRYGAATHSPIRPFTIGWIGTPVTAPYLHAIESALAEVCKDNAARLVTIGSGEMVLKGVPHEVRAWSERTEAGDVKCFDCGIMPLPDAAWERGKCGYKLIQYMACGLPVVASPVGVNVEIVEHGVNGFLAGSHQEWVEALISLRDNHELCKSMGFVSRNRVEQKYCLNVTAPRMLTLLESAVRTRAAVVATTQEANS